MSNYIINESKIQKSVLNKYLSRLENEYFEDINEKYSVYQKIFNSAYKDQIINLKESEYEQIFQLRLFQTVLGYQIDIGKESPRNIKFQPKSKEGFADGGIYLPNADDIDKKNIAVIEMKDSNTREINKINNQAFKYFKTDPNIKYTITCNFLRIRIYLDNTKDYIDFPIFNLSLADFKLFYLFLSYRTVLVGWPSLMKNETVHEEEKIEKRFYVDYSKFRDELFKNIVKNNTNISELILFNRTQKLLDRFIFIFFAEDKGLIYPNFIESVINYWKDEKKRFGEKSLYEDFNRYFVLLDKGREKAHNTEAIFAFNGGLFKKDRVLENLKIDCDVLATNVQKLSSYDFTSQITVDILGHIFEHSLSEIEETEAKLKGEQVDKSKGKRKKDGVFYTPKYITKYIVDNTVGKLCNEKKSNLELDQDFDIIEYQKSGGRVNKKGEKLFHTLESYKNWLLELKIVDPACGSGAFLNEALSFLIKEHKEIDDLIAELTNTPLRIFDTEKSILENNIYGVDINEESVEIAKLSMWLRTAQKGRQLSDLSNNIKCGNSLIDDPKIAGDKAFNWENEFPEVFKNGGFDVVIGNPPYVSHDRVNNKKYLSVTYKSHQGFADLFCYFYELGVKLLKKDGVLSFITSNSFLKAEYGAPLRKFLLNNSTLLEIINIEDAQIFSDAIVNSSILSLQKNSNKNRKCLIVNKKYDLEIDFWLYIENNKFYYQQLDFDELPWNLIKPEILNLRNKIKGKNQTLEELDTKIRLGIATGSNEAFIVSEEIKRELITQDQNSIDLIKPILRGKDIEQYYYNLPPLYLLLTKNGIDVHKDYPAIFNHLESFGDSFKNRGAKGQHWTNLRACSFFDDFKKDKIVWIELTDKGRFSRCSDEIYLLNSAYFLLPPKGYSIGYLITILNSKLIKFYLKQIANTSGVGTARWINIYVKEFPIYEASIEIQTEFDNLEKIMMNKLLSHNRVSKAFTKYIHTQINLEKISRKLKNWHELEFGEFIKELNKAIKKVGGEKLTKMDGLDWMEVFETKKAEAQALKAQINQTDKEINTMVYELYGLTGEEIAIIENNLN